MQGLPAAVWAVGISANMQAEKMDRVAEILTERADLLRMVLDEGPVHAEDEALVI
jgi:hypothetical protein